MDSAYISILVTDSTDTLTLYEHIASRLNVELATIDSTEIVLAVPKNGCGYSLSQLTSIVDEITVAKVTMFELDADMLERITYDLRY